MTNFKDKILDNLNAMQAAKTIDRINFESIYNESKFSKRIITLKTVNNELIFNIKQNFNNINVIQDKNKNIILNINGRNISDLQSTHSDLIINALDDIKNIKLAIDITKKPSKTEFFLTNHTNINSYQKDNEEWVIDGHKITDKKELASSIYGHIDKMDDTEKKSLIKSIESKKTSKLNHKASC
jgi:hypothetical protein